jgi:arylsulfatase A-like enzyme
MKILFIDIDTLRPDHMSCYGYLRNTTPNIDKIAEEGIRFNRYYCSDAPCLPSRAALITGMFGIHNGVVGHGGTGADRRIMGAARDFRDKTDENNFHNIFRKAGMYTASLSTFPERHSAWWFNAGFNETHNVGKGGIESGDEVLPVALDWIDRNARKENWFLHVHLWDPHTPYRVPASFGNPFEKEPLPSWFTQKVIDRHVKCVGPHTINELNMYDDAENPKFPRFPGKASDGKGLRRIIDGYDCGVAFADHIVGKIFDALRAGGVFDETAVIVTSDHGENFGELGIYAEHGTADRATCRIPMIIRWPGGRKGTDDGLHYNIDLCPTMAELLGVPGYAGWDGSSYADTLKKDGHDGRPYLVLSQMAHVCQRSVRYDRWLYLRTYHDGFHLFPAEMLFDLEEDPHEQKNIAEQHLEICGRAARMLLEWHDAMMKTSDSMIDPLWTVIREGGPYHAQRSALPKYLDRLMKTGREEGAEKLRLKYHIEKK